MCKKEKILVESCENGHIEAPMKLLYPANYRALPKFLF